MKKVVSTLLLSTLIYCPAVAEDKVYTSADIKSCGELTCDLNEKPITGLLKFYYENGKLEGEIPYKNGEIDGLLKGYYENGKLEAEIPYKNGEIDGLSKTYYEDGSLRVEIPYKNGKLEGLSKTYYKNGDLLSEITFKNGTTVSGFMYEPTGKKTPMTNAHLHNFTRGLSK